MHTAREFDLVRTHIDAEIHGILSNLSDALQPLSPTAPELSQALSAIATSGKRLRAALCYWSWRAHGADTADPRYVAVIQVAAALELFQISALIHDDVMDASDTRRGVPTTHQQFAQRHTAHQLLGSKMRFGENVAILAGDLALAHCHHVLAQAVHELPQDIRTHVMSMFCTMETEVIAGQYLDIVLQAHPFGSDPSADEDQAFAVLRAKSAGYSVAYPIALGAVLAGNGKRGAEHLIQAMIPLGEAFQLRDDLLGVFGHSERTGKPAGDDLREGKRTVLICRALASASPEDAAFLREELGQEDLDTTTLQSLREILVKTGAQDAVEQLIAERVQEAHQALDAAQLHEPGLSELHSLADALTARER